jgi:molybdate transport system ATP-binding protein
MLLVDLAHRFDGTALAMRFEAPTPGVIALFGPSGAGKSTLLQAIAGLLRADRARVELNGAQLHSMPPERRRIGYVFQDGRLFPHMNVAANLRYGARRAPPGQVGFDEAVALLGIESLLGRMPLHLSGGERQRVAIGRALLCNPALILMDEPLAALDRARRDEILPYLARLRARAEIPIIYATHALDEVLRLADTLVLIEAGHVRAAGPVAALAARADLALAARDDASGVLLGEVRTHWLDRGLSEIGCVGTILLVPLLAAAPGSAVRLRVPAREVILALDAPREISVNNVLRATFMQLVEDRRSHAALVQLSLAGGALLARVTLDAAERLKLAPGKPVLALIKSMSVESLAE